MPKRRPDSPPDDGGGMVLGRRADARMVLDPRVIAIGHDSDCMQAGWTTFERDLPSAAIAVFNRCTLHRLDAGKLVLIGTAAHTPSSVMSESIGTTTVLWADLQENPQAPTLLAVSDDRVARVQRKCLPACRLAPLMIGCESSMLRLARWCGMAVRSAQPTEFWSAMCWCGHPQLMSCLLLLMATQVLASDSAVHVICWPLTGSEPKTMSMTLPVRVPAERPYSKWLTVCR